MSVLINQSLDHNPLRHILHKVGDVIVNFAHQIDRARYLADLAERNLKGQREILLNEILKER
jgi:hypothetical protein